jgi:signal peptidase I
MVDTEKDNSSKVVSIGKQIRDYAIAIGAALIIALILRNYVVTRADVDGSSMETTLSDKDVIFVEKLSLLTGKLKRGEIVIFDSKNVTEDIYVKRVIGIEGDEIQLKDGKVILNGQELKEEYIAQGVNTNPGSFMTKDKVYKVEKGYVFVLGDNREHSHDSRNIGPISIKDVKGHTIVRVYPFKNFKLF